MPPSGPTRRRTRVASITEIAEREGLTDSFVGRVLALTTLAPDVLQAVLDGRQPPRLTLQRVIGSVSMAWAEQRLSFRLEEQCLAARVGP